MDPRASLDHVEKRKFLTLPRLKLRPLDHPARSQSLYRLSYPGFSTDTPVMVHILTMRCDVPTVIIMKSRLLSSGI
jgi:hypothetical protein